MQSDIYSAGCIQKIARCHIEDRPELGASNLNFNSGNSNIAFLSPWLWIVTLEIFFELADLSLCLPRSFILVVPLDCRVSKVQGSPFFEIPT